MGTRMREIQVPAVDPARIMRTSCVPVPVGDRAVPKRYPLRSARRYSVIVAVEKTAPPIPADASFLPSDRRRP